LLHYGAIYGELLSNILPATKCEGFEALTPLVMMNSIFWDTTPYSLLKINTRFREKWCLNHQDWGLGFDWCLLHARLLLGLLLNPEDCDDMFLRIVG
jgi:hypothetical protein